MTYMTLRVPPFDSFWGVVALGCLLYLFGRYVMWVRRK